MLIFNFRFLEMQEEQQQGTKEDTLTVLEEIFCDSAIVLEFWIGKLLNVFLWIHIRS